MKKTELEPTRWGTILTLLSMDIMVPFYESMGLKIPDRESFLATLRCLILSNRGAYAANPTVVPSLAERVLEEVERYFGKEFRDPLLMWGTYVFEDIPADHPHSNVWKRLFSTCAHSPNRSLWNRLGLPSDKSDSLLKDYIEITDNDDVWDSIEELDQRLDEGAISEWDLSMFVRHQFDRELGDPFNWVINTVNLYRFQCFLNKLLAQLSDSQIESLWEQAKVLAKEKKLSMDEIVENLRHPCDLKEQP